MRPVKKMDFALFAIVVVLVTIGILLVFSSSYYKAQEDTRIDNQWFFVEKVVEQVLLGTVLAFITYMMPLKFFKKFWWLFAALAFGLLILPLTKNWEPVNGAYRWINLFGFSIMPSEWAKLALIVTLASTLPAQRKNIHSSAVHLMPFFAVIGVMFFMIYKQPDLSSALVLVIIGFSMLFICGMHISGYLGIGAAVLMGVMYIQNVSGFRSERITAFFDKSDVITQINYQSWMSRYALSYGGIFGTGAGSGKFNKKFLPEAQNDFIMATIGEEFGFIGVMVTIILLLAFIYRGVKIAMNAKDMYTCLLATGFTAMFSFQVLVNLAVVTATIPVTGMPLPFISLGGNSMLISLISVGFLLNISKNAQVE